MLTTHQNEDFFFIRKGIIIESNFLFNELSTKEAKFTQEIQKLNETITRNEELRKTKEFTHEIQYLKESMRRIEANMRENTERLTALSKTFLRAIRRACESTPLPMFE